MKLNDEVIAHIAKLLQIAILTGTDIVDHLRMLTLESGENGKLTINPEYQEVFEASLEKMLQNVNNNAESEPVAE